MVSRQFLKDSQILIGIIVSVIGISASGITFYWVGRGRAETQSAIIELRVDNLEKRMDITQSKFDSIDNRLLQIEKAVVRIEQSVQRTGNP